MFGSGSARKWKRQFSMFHASIHFVPAICLAAAMRSLYHFHVWISRFQFWNSDTGAWKRRASHKINTEVGKRALCNLPWAIVIATCSYIPFWTCVSCVLLSDLIFMFIRFLSGIRGIAPFIYIECCTHVFGFVAVYSFHLFKLECIHFSMFISFAHFILGLGVGRSCRKCRWICRRINTGVCSSGITGINRCLKPSRERRARRKKCG